MGSINSGAEVTKGKVSRAPASSLIPDHWSSVTSSCLMSLHLWLPHRIDRALRLWTITNPTFPKPVLSEGFGKSWIQGLSRTYLAMRRYRVHATWIDWGCLAIAKGTRAKAIATWLLSVSEARRIEPGVCRPHCHHTLQWVPLFFHLGGGGGGNHRHILIWGPLYPSLCLASHGWHCLLYP